MAKDKAYLKLNDNATIFTNTYNNVIIRNKEVVEVPASFLINDNSIREGLKGGHIQKADKDEFDAWENQRPKDIKEKKAAEETPLTNPITGKHKTNAQGQTLNEAGGTMEKPTGKSEGELDIMTKKELVELIMASPEIPEVEKNEKDLRKMDAEALVTLYRTYYK